MQNILKVSEIFKSIQGEGRYIGTPMLFIRLAGCNRTCSWCDTKYSWLEGIEMDISSVVELINKTKLPYACWTGGEPLLQYEQIYEVIKATPAKRHHLETNGDLLTKKIAYRGGFNYIALSPKDAQTARKWFLQNVSVMDIKVVTDLETVGVDILQFATMLMPLTTFNVEQDKKICKRVWQYCTEKNVMFSARLQAFIFGKKRGV